MTESIDKVEEPHSKVDMVQRDGETSMAVGLFVLALGLPVLFATIFALDRPRAAIVNAISGIVLILIGGGATLYGWTLYKRATRSAKK